MGDYEGNGNNDNGGGGLEFIAGALAVIAAVPTAIVAVNDMLKSDISLPNIPFRVTDWGMWDTLSECNGWRLQQNIITKHCRIVDPEGWRRAWGTKNGMMKALEALEDNIKKIGV